MSASPHAVRTSALESLRLVCSVVTVSSFRMPEDEHAPTHGGFVAWSRFAFAERVVDHVFLLKLVDPLPRKVAPRSISSMLSSCHADEWKRVCRRRTQDCKSAQACGRSLTAAARRLRPPPARGCPCCLGPGMDPLPRKVADPRKPGRHCGVNVPPASRRLKIRGGGIHERPRGRHC